MGKSNSQRMNAAMLDGEDDDSVSSLSTLLSDAMVMSCDEKLQFYKDSALNRCLNALNENERGTTRKKALSTIVETFKSSLQHEFVENKFVPLLQQLLCSIKGGYAHDIALASQAIGLLALTTGPGERAQKILEESMSSLSLALMSRSETSKTTSVDSLLGCLAIITFIGGNDPEESMQLMCRLGKKFVRKEVDTKASLAITAAVVSSWSFLLTTVDGSELDHEDLEQTIYYFYTLLDKDDRSVRVAAGEALALIFEIGNWDIFFGEDKGSSDRTCQELNSAQDFTRIQVLKGKILNQLESLSVEEGGKDFQNVLDFFEHGLSPETSMKIGEDSVCITTWRQLIQLNFLKNFLGGGFVKHMQENEFLHGVFGFTPKRKQFLETSKKKLHKSSNSDLNKARTQLEQPNNAISGNKNTGHYVVGGSCGEDV